MVSPVKMFVPAMIASLLNLLPAASAAA
jgi:hypothetical protein